MLEMNLVTNNQFNVLELKGRIDGLSAPEVEEELTKLTTAGVRIIIVDFSSVSYLSSAGLRIFLSVQKTLKKIDGELILVSLNTSINEVFKISGFASLFRIYKSFSEIPELEKSLQDKVIETTINAITIQLKKINQIPGGLLLIGTQDNFYSSAYNKEDVVNVVPSDIQFGTGLAVLGDDDYNEYKNLFGEALIINKNFFSYPALKKSAVDFMLSEEVNPSLTFKFLHGFGFNGDYSATLKFDNEEFISLNQVVDIAKSIAENNLFGVVLLAESAGIYGMHLKQSPIIENKPLSGKIFDQQNFADWIDFPLEPAYSGNIIAASGIVAKNKEHLSSEHQTLFSEDADFHIHAGIFSKGLLSKNLVSFEDELNRVLKELQVYKIQHLLGKSKFKSGMLAIVELKENISGEVN